MHRIVRLSLFSLFLVGGGGAYAQKATTDKGCKPPINRQLRHDFIDREQKNALRADGKADDKFYASNDEGLNFLITQSMVQRVDALQCTIERDTATNQQRKVTYLSGLERILKNFTASFRSRKIAASAFPQIVEVFEQAIHADRKGEPIQPVIEKASYEVGNIVLSSNAFDANPSILNARNTVLAKYMFLHPEKILPTLKNNPDLPNRDSLILRAAYKNPKLLYDYAAANNRLAYAIRSLEDPLVRTVSKMATSKGSGQIYFPFLDNILRGRQTLEEIDAVKNDPVKYYRLLVKTRIDYVNRSMQKDTAMEMKALNDMLAKKARETFVNTINGLHESPDAIRFKILEPLTAPELYYLIVTDESEMYTSSYTKGVYPRMMQKAGKRGDSLLMMIGFDRYRKFIRMAAGFNTLSNFLSSFPEAGQAEVLMRGFVNGLEKTSTLEDGVDVADSYASIAETIKPLATRMLEYVKDNYDRNRAVNNQRGTVMYELLYKLFQSADSTNKIDFSKEFGIPPVYTVSNESLANDSGRTAIQVFFYGDEDGRNNYRLFVPQFQNADWKKVEDNKYWIAFRSVKGKPVTLYANKPLDEESGEIDKAQASLIGFLEEKGIEPSVVIHRGHSYYANYTIEKIRPSARIVYLGSCGGYHLINEVLERAPDAHIISSKQIGKEVINRPFMKLLTEKLRGGQNIDWISFWRDFEKQAGDVDGFTDYIAPYKNLGAIFIKAYNTRMGTETAKSF